MSGISNDEENSKTTEEKQNNLSLNIQPEGKLSHNPVKSFQRPSNGVSQIYLQPTPVFLELIHSNKSDESRIMFTRQELIDHLKSYVMRNRLFDVDDPRINHCDHLLQRLFSVDRFSIDQVLALISANTTQVKLPKLDIGCDVIDGDSHVIHANIENLKKTKKRKRSDEGISPGKKRRSSSSFSTVILTSDDGGRCSVDVAFHSDLESCIFWSSDEEGGLVIECYDDASERLSIQSKETVLIQDLEEEEWTSEEDILDISMSPYRIEYDVASESDRGLPDDSDTASEPEEEPEIAAMLVVGESDVEFFADYSDSDDDCSDKEIPFEDKWRCQCGQANTPLSRHCHKCWAVRPGWLQAPKRRQLPSKYRTDSDRLTDLEDDCPVPVSEANIASLASSEPATNLDFVDGSDLELLSSQTSGYFSQTSLPSAVEDIAVPGPSGLSKFNAKPLSRSHSLIESSKTGINLIQRSYSYEDKPNDESGKNLLPELSELRKKIDNEVKEDERVDEDNLCIMCLSRPKNASLVHGNTGHQVTCFKCAKKLRRRGGHCPVCRKSIAKVIRNYIV